MGTKIRNFLRLRKQSDAVKIICLFVLTGVVFLVGTVYHVWGIYAYVNTPAEYILTGDGMVSQKRMDELLQTKDVSKVSRQMEISVAVQHEGAQTTVDCTMLSSDYMAELFGAEVSEGTSRIYMNEEAFAEFKEEISENSGGMAVGEGKKSKEGESELTVRYSMGEEAVAVGGVDRADADDTGDGTGTDRGMLAPKYRSAKLIVRKADREEAESFIYTAETESQLLREATGLRVRFETHDLDGLHVDNLKKLGYEIENEDMIMGEEYELQMKLLHIRYGLVVCGICIVGAVMLWRNIMRP